MEWVAVIGTGLSIIFFLLKHLLSKKAIKKAEEKAHKESQSTKRDSQVDATEELRQAITKESDGISAAMDAIDAELKKKAVGPEGLALITRFEGLSLTAYQCSAGVYTIGFGHTKTAKPGMTISRKQAEELLLDDIEDAEAAVNRLVRVPLSENQFDALVSFVFNVGAGAFEESTLLRKLNQGKRGEAAQEFDRWVYAGGKKLAGLERRRKAEKELFLK